MSFCDLEGFGLPPLEAAFCGNAVVGYTGQGAREYFEPPIFKTIESGNIHAFVLAMIATIAEIELGSLEQAEFSAQLSALKSHYSVEKQREQLRVFADRVQEVMA